MALLSDILGGISASWTTLLIEFLLLTALAIVAYGFRTWYRLRSFKGPLLASFSDLWLIRSTISGSSHLDFFEVTEKYGILRLQNAGAADFVR